MSWRKPCPTCGADNISHYTEFNFCTKCWKRIQDICRYILIQEVTNGLRYLADVESKERDKEEGDVEE